MNKKNHWVKVNDCRPLEANHCEYGFICWVDGAVEMTGVDDGVSWDEVSHFMPLYDLETPAGPKEYKTANNKHEVGSTSCNVL